MMEKITTLHIDPTNFNIIYVCNQLNSYIMLLVKQLEDFIPYSLNILRVEILLIRGFEHFCDSYIFRGLQKDM